MSEKDLFPEFYHRELRRYAALWTARYPIIQKITLHQGVDTNKPYVLVLEIPDYENPRTDQRFMRYWIGGPGVVIDELFKCLKKKNFSENISLGKWELIIYCQAKGEYVTTGIHDKAPIWSKGTGVRKDINGDLSSGYSMVLYDVDAPAISPDPLQEFAQLKNEKNSWEKALEVAVLVGIYCEKNCQDGTKIVQKQLKESLEAGGNKNLPKTMIEIIGEAIPQPCRQPLFDLIKGLEKETIAKNETMTPEDKRELGRLQNEKHKRDRSLEAAIKVGIRCEGLGRENTKMTRSMLQDFIDQMKIDLSREVVNKILKAIPPEYRQGAGRPKNGSSIDVPRH